MAIDKDSITSPSSKLLEILYEEQRKEFLDKIEELKNPRIIYVTDLVGCSYKYILRQKFPELTFSFEPAAMLGNLVHKGLEEILSRKGYTIEYPIEYRVCIDEKEYVIKGRVDAYNESLREVVEIKTARGSQGIPHEHHILQLLIYMNILDSNKGILVYITPDKLLEYYVEKIPIDIEMLVRDLLENRRHPRWSWECRYCIFSKICPYRIMQTT